MPAFTFEKLSPPAPEAITEPVADVKPRGKMGRLLDRFVGRSAREANEGGKAFDSRQAELR